jgi:nucleotide-binding universal stress UspA family protein
MFKRILVAFDGSNGAEEALRRAVELSRTCGSELISLTVFRHYSHLESSFSMVRPGDPDRMDDSMRSHAAKVADRAKSVAEAEGGELRAFVRAGPPARSIIAFAAEHDADLIVVGSRGLGAVEGFLLGSVSHKVTGLADRPVLVV